MGYITIKTSISLISAGISRLAMFDYRRVAAPGALTSGRLPGPRWAAIRVQ